MRWAHWKAEIAGFPAMPPATLSDVACSRYDQPKCLSGTVNKLYWAAMKGLTRKHDRRLMKQWIIIFSNWVHVTYQPPYPALRLHLP